ncbi:MAG: beta-glucosidase BglX [Reichenbachiella sp.]|uniref:beta-glucosidase BglX n=1 Tax=Reichenbachiella sp. TaxID=2184521 RepID=UPI0032651C78
MKRNIIISAFIIITLTFSSCASRSKDEVEIKIDDLLSEMTLEEKIGQLTLFTSSWTQTGPTMREGYLNDVKQGKCGNIFNAHTAEYTSELQRIAVEETRLGIPLLFGYDVIHGYKTIFPIPLAEACSWDLDLIEKSARLSAKEAAAAGLHWNFNPMVDISRDPRWGRVAEGSGEDTYLGSLIASAKVRGIQGDDLKDESTLLACVKHFAAYGAAQAGRDYHTVDMSERVLRETYLPPYRAAIDAGSATVMTSFNELDGVPASGSKYLMTDVLREEWKFRGFVVTDYTAINEMIPHGFAKDTADAALLAMKAGVDMDMQGGTYLLHLQDLIDQGKVQEAAIDQAVRRILKAKFDLGLFDDPYRYSDVDRENQVVLSKEMMDHSREAGRKSIVLLKNDAIDGKTLLPLNKKPKQLALIGPLAHNQMDILGTWHASGDASKSTTVLDGIKEVAPDIDVVYAEGCKTYGEDRSGFAEAISVAKRSDIVLMAVGENYRQNGEAASRTNLNLPGMQEELMEAILDLGKPVVLILMSGRPLTIENLSQKVPAILNTWHLGTKGGSAIADVLFGDYNPSGKLVMTFPRNVGQIPIYYNMKNTGRPFKAKDKYTSKYLDVANDPLYPFGYGLSYTAFEYSDLSLSQSTMRLDEDLNISVGVTNTGSRAGEEVVQLYIRDLVGNVTRPVKELKGFKKISLEPGQTQLVEFTISAEDLKFYNQDMSFKAEPGDFLLYVGGSSDADLSGKFELIN